ADHHLVAAGADVGRVVALAQGDAQALELGRHRRVDRLVAALDLVAELARQRRHPAHEGAGDAEDVELHCRSNAARIRPKTSSRVPTPSTTASLPASR